MNREQAIDVLQKLPQEFDLEELLEKLIFIEKVEQGLKQLDEEKNVLHQNVKDIISRV